MCQVKHKMTNSYPILFCRGLCKDPARWGKLHKSIKTLNSRLHTIQIHKDAQHHTPHNVPHRHTKGSHCLRNVSWIGTFLKVEGKMSHLKGSSYANTMILMPPPWTPSPLPPPYQPEQQPQPQQTPSSQKNISIVWCPLWEKYLSFWRARKLFLG